MKGIINDIDFKKHQKAFKTSTPFQHVVIDNFFESDLLKEVSENFPCLEDDRWFRFRKKIGEYENIFESGMNAISKPDNMNALSRSFLYNINSLEFCKNLEKITGIEGILPDLHWHYTGLRINTPGASQLVHSDALFHPHLKQRKILTCMIYMTEWWDEKHDGCLELWNDSMTECVHRIAPIFNRLVIFKNTDTSFHGVPNNNHFRKAITMSYLLNEKSESRWRALFVKRPEDKELDNFDLIASQRSKLNDTK